MKKNSIAKIVIPVITSWVLTACVGIESIKTATPESSPIERTEYSKYVSDDKNLTPPWAGTAHSENGSVQFNTQKSWCGVAVWAAIIPIPLILPVCKSYTEVSFENNTPKTITRVDTKETTYACGPGFLLVTELTSNPRFCGSLSYQE